MEIRVTPSARAELLDTVVRLRQRDRRGASRLIALIEMRLEAVAGGIEDAPELTSPWRSASAGGHRLYVRERDNGLWLLAVWPEPPPTL